MCGTGRDSGSPKAGQPVPGPPWSASPQPHHRSPNYAPHWPQSLSQNTPHFRTCRPQAKSSPFKAQLKPQRSFPPAPGQVGSCCHLAAVFLCHHAISSEHASLTDCGDTKRGRACSVRAAPLAATLVSSGTAGARSTSDSFSIRDLNSFISISLP